MTDSKSTADYEPEFPPDLIDDVLLRLPAKSIGRFRCVSKPWKSLLSSPKFIKSHFNFHLHRTTPIAVISGDYQHLITFPADGSDGPSRKVTFPFLVKDYWMIIKAACHGFVLVDVREANLLVDVRDRCRCRMLNPVTLESFELPGFSVPLNLVDPIWVMFGMGYDSCSDDYKIVQLQYDMYRTYEPMRQHFRICVGVYSLKMKCWTIVEENSPYYPQSGNPGVYMNGFVHWVTETWDDHLELRGEIRAISAFNLALDVFEEVPLPKDLCNDRIEYVTVLRECLAVVCEAVNGCVCVWLMKDYGVQESWHKLVINTEDRYTIHTVLSLSQEDEFVLTLDSRPHRDRMIAYSSRTGSWRYLVHDDLPRDIRSTVVISAECLLPSSCISA